MKENIPKCSDLISGVSTFPRHARATFLHAMLVCMGICTLTGAPLLKTNGPVKVEIRNTAGQYQLYVDGKPFYIKGAGLEFGCQEKLAEHGGNSLRTWTTENGREPGQQVLDRAMSNGLYVTMGLNVARQRHGFDYNEPAGVARQLDQVKAQVLKFKDSPEILEMGI